MGNILYSPDTARSCSHPNYELWNPASDIKESKIVEMLLGHNFSPQSKFFVVENRGKAVAIFLQRNEKIGEKTLLLSVPSRQTLWFPAYLTPSRKARISGYSSWGFALFLVCLAVSQPTFVRILSETGITPNIHLHTFSDMRTCGSIISHTVWLKTPSLPNYEAISKQEIMLRENLY